LTMTLSHDRDSMVELCTCQPKIVCEHTSGMTIDGLARVIVDERVRASPTLRIRQ